MTSHEKRVHTRCATRCDGKRYDGDCGKFVEAFKAARDAYVSELDALITGLGIKNVSETTEEPQKSALMDPADDAGDNKKDFLDALLSDPCEELAFSESVAFEAPEPSKKQTVPAWLAGLSDLFEAQCADITYTKTQSRIMLLKGKQVLSRLKFVDDSDSSAYVEWVRTLTKKGLEAAYAVEIIFAAYLYTVDCKDCPCETLEKCEEKQRSEDAAKEKGERVKKHRAKPAPPKDNAALGWNSAPWAVLNWTLRVGFDPSAAEEVRKKALDVCQLYTPMRITLEDALELLPKTRRVVFRGIPVPVARKYKLNVNVEFAPFTSTSLEGKVALNFMDKHSEGCFFIIRVNKASMINFCSWYPEQEEGLLTTFSTFQVKKKLSKTLLQMLGCRYDVVTLAQVGEQVSAEEVIGDLCDAMKKTVFIYDLFLTRYVEGRVAHEPPPQLDARKIFGVLREWLEGKEKQLRANMLVVGAGGTGKTSAALACLSWLITHNEDFGERRLFPMFVPLPSISNVTQNGAIDKHIQEMLGISNEAMRLLQERCQPIQLLDSLDEVPMEAADKKNKVSHESIRALVDRNPWLNNGRSIMSTRDEFLNTTGYGESPHEVISTDPTRCLVQYLQPLKPDDSVELVRRQLLTASAAVWESWAEEERKAEQQRVDAQTSKIVAAIERADSSLLEHPYALFMITVVMEKHPEMLTGRVGRQMRLEAIYEQFLDDHIESIPNSDAQNVAREWMTVTAVDMLQNACWQTSVLNFLKYFEGKWNQENIRKEVLMYVPRRCEDDYDEKSSLSFSHKSLAEFLCAYRLLKDHAMFSQITRRFSKESPMVLEFFSRLSASSTKTIALRNKLAEEVLVPAVKASAKKNATVDALSQASNALALLCVSNYMMADQNFANVIIEDCALTQAKLDGINFTGATFTRCLLDNSFWICTNITGAKFVDCVAETEEFGSKAPPGTKNTTIDDLCFLPETCGGAVAVTSRELKSENSRVISVYRVSDWTLIKSAGHLAAKKLERTIFMSDDGECEGIAMASSTLVVLHPETLEEVSIPLDLGTTAISLRRAADVPNFLVGTNDGRVLLVNGEMGDGKLAYTIAKATAKLHESLLRAFPQTNSQYIVTVANDTKLKVWDASALWEAADNSTDLPSPVFEFESPKISTNRTLAYASSDNGEYFAACPTTNRLRIWRYGDWRELASIPTLHSDWARSMTFCCNDTILVTVSNDTTFCVVDVLLGKLVRRVGAASCQISAVCAGRRNLYIGDNDGRVSAFHAFHETGFVIPSTKKLLKPVGANEGAFKYVNMGVMTADGTRMYHATRSYSIFKWELTIGSPVAKSFGHQKEVLAVDIDDSGKLLGSISSDLSLRVVRTDNGMKAAWTTASAKAAPFKRIRFTHGENCVVLAVRNSELIVFDAESGKELQTVSDIGVSQIVPYKDKLYIGTTAGVIATMQYNLEREKDSPDPPLSELFVPGSGEKPPKTAKGVGAMAVNQAGTLLVYATFGSKELKVRNLTADDTDDHVLKGHAAAIICAAFLQDDRNLILSGGMDRAIRLWWPDKDGNYSTKNMTVVGKTEDTIKWIAVATNNSSTFAAMGLDAAIYRYEEIDLEESTKEAPANYRLSTVIRKQPRINAVDVIGKVDVKNSRISSGLLHVFHSD